jgi:uncharacterized protein YndB with AHSA1/START domain
MATFTTTKQIDAPLASVFALFTDLEQAAGRIAAITRLEVLTPGPVGVGTRFRETRKMFGREHSEEMEITAFDAGHSYEVTCQSCGAEYRTLFRFTPEGAGTRVDLEFQTRALSLFAKLMKPLGFLMMGTMKKCMDQDLEDLKKAAKAAISAASDFHAVP